MSDTGIHVRWDYIRCVDWRREDYHDVYVGEDGEKAGRLRIKRPSIESVIYMEIWSQETGETAPHLVKRICHHANVPNAMHARSFVKQIVELWAEGRVEDIRDDISYEKLEQPV